jgi:NAD(P)-dependent dehydrogenase (short-subunit alcohol dehydrogenase family)
MKLEGVVAVVLGGARGIGKAYCVSLLDRKAKVVCSDLLEDVGRETEKELQQKYGAENVVFRKCNAASDQEIRDTLRYAKEHFGRLDIVVNNVGIVDETNWQTMIDINLGTTVRVTNATLEMIGKDNGGNGGALVHTASNGGLVPAFFTPLYCATKSAMIAYTRAWTHKINYDAHGVRMFTICPKMTDTPFLAQNTDPTKVVKLDVLLKIFDINDKTQVLRPEWVGEALVNGLEDDSVNGSAIQLLGREPIYHFVGPNDKVIAAERINPSTS